MGCDDYALTVDLPSTYAASNPNNLIDIEMTIDNPAGDLDRQLLDSTGQKAGSSGEGPGVTGKIQIAAGSGKRTYTVRVVPYAPAGASITLTIKLVKGTATAPVDPCAQSGTATATSAILHPGLAKDLASLPVGAHYGAC